MWPFFSTMEEAFWKADDGGDDNANNAADTTSPTPSQPSSQTEHIIYGSPLMMIGGILLFVLIVFSLISEARSDGIEFSPELFGFGVVALVLPWYGYFQYRKTVVISWRQDERRVEVFEGIRNSDERSTMFAYTSEPRDQILIQSETTHFGGHHAADYDHTDSKTEYWLVVKRRDGTTVASSDAAKNTYFLKRIKQYLDQLQ